MLTSAPSTGDTFNLNNWISAVVSISVGDLVDIHVDGLVLGPYSNDIAYFNYSNELGYNAAEN